MSTHFMLIGLSPCFAIAVCSSTFSHTPRSLRYIDSVFRARRTAAPSSAVPVTSSVHRRFSSSYDRIECPTGPLAMVLHRCFWTILINPSQSLSIPTSPTFSPSVTMLSNVPILKVLTSCATFLLSVTIPIVLLGTSSVPLDHFRKFL